MYRALLNFSPSLKLKCLKLILKYWRTINFRNAKFAKINGANISGFTVVTYHRLITDKYVGKLQSRMHL